MANRKSTIDYPLPTTHSHTVPFGKGTIQFSLLSGMRVTQATSKPFPPVEDEKAAVAKALAHPIGTPPLQEMVRPGNKVCIVFTDVTRSCPDIVAAYKMIPASTMDEALQIAAGDTGSSCDVLVVPHSLLTLPVIQE
jgi:hypothetical protein